MQLLKSIGYAVLLLAALLIGGGIMWFCVLMFYHLWHDQHERFGAIIFGMGIFLMLVCAVDDYLRS